MFLLGGMVWVWLGGTLLLLWFRTCESGLGTLLGPEETPVGGVFFLVPLLAWWSNAIRFRVCGVWLWWLRWCWGVVVC